MKPTKEITKRLEYLRGEIEEERISYGEIAELVSLKDYIHGSDVQLLEWAGVEEFPAEHGDIWCIRYNAEVLPDEKGDCSLCGATLNNGYEEAK